VALEEDSKFRNGASTVGAFVVDEYKHIVDAGLHRGLTHDSLHERQPRILRIGRRTAGRNGNQGGGLMSRVETSCDLFEESLMGILMSIGVKEETQRQTLREVGLTYGLLSGIALDIGRQPVMR
jgi:hypothetical protein